MSDPFFAEIRLFGFNYPPIDWAYCNGALMTQNQNPALYAILGTRYGGNVANRTFQLPNLQGLAPVGVDPTNQYFALGVVSGTETVTINNSQTPEHDHALNGVGGAQTTLVNTPVATDYLARNLTLTTTTTYIPPAGIATKPMAETMIGVTCGAASGGVTAHENRQPYLGLNFCICTSGYFPVNPG